ncbi:MAG: hypothetical protein R3B99_01560 [Polyangiales bacterium]
MQTPQPVERAAMRCGYDFVERKGPPKRPKPVGWAFVVAGGAMTFNAVLALAEGRRAFGVVHQSVFVAMGVLLCAWGVLELRSRGAAKSD